MAHIGCICWSIVGLFFIIIGFNTMPWTMTLVMAISFIGGLIDGFHKIKKQKEKEERERQKRREKWKRIANKKNLTDDFDPV